MIRVGVIGSGRWGKNHLRVLSEEHCKLSGLADLDTEKVNLATALGIPFETDFRQLLPIVDALIIATPASTHFDITRECLQAGKHVLVEKPLSLFSQQARELMEIASQAGLVLAVGHQYRMNPAVLTLKDELRKIGQIHHVNINYLNMNLTSPVDCTIIFDLGSHLFDLLLFLISEMPKKIMCSTSNNSLIFKRRSITNISADYGNFKAFLEMSWNHSSKDRDAWFIGSKSSIYADFFEQTVIKYSSGVFGPGINLAIQTNEPLKEEVRQFIECIEKSERPVKSVEQACRAVELCEVAARSLDAGSEVYL